MLTQHNDTTTISAKLINCVNERIHYVSHAYLQKHKVQQISKLNFGRAQLGGELE